MSASGDVALLVLRCCLLAAMVVPGAAGLSLGRDFFGSGRTENLDMAVGAGGEDLAIG